MQLSSESCLSAAGCNLEVDVTWKYLNFFLDDDAELGRIERDYGSGQMLTGTAKGILIKVCLHGAGGFAETLACCGLPRAANVSACAVSVCEALCQRLPAEFAVSPTAFDSRDALPQELQDIVARHKAARARVTDEMVDAFMAPRAMPDLFG